MASRALEARSRILTEERAAKLCGVVRVPMVCLMFSPDFISHDNSIDIDRVQRSKENISAGRMRPSKSQAQNFRKYQPRWAVGGAEAIGTVPWGLEER